MKHLHQASLKKPLIGCTRKMAAAKATATSQRRHANWKIRISNAKQARRTALSRQLKFRVRPTTQQSECCRVIEALSESKTRTGAPEQAPPLCRTCQRTVLAIIIAGTSMTKSADFLGLNSCAQAQPAKTQSKKKCENTNIHPILLLFLLLSWSSRPLVFQHFQLFPPQKHPQSS